MASRPKEEHVSPPGPPVTDTAAGRAGRRPRSTTESIALVAVAAGFLCAVGPLSIPVGPVPITLQTLAVVLVGLLLGPVRGAAAVLVYMAVGAAGAPVFASFQAGLPVLYGGTAGYLWSFPVAAVLAGLGAVLVVRRARRSLVVPGLLVTAFVAMAAVYPAGLLVLKTYYGMTWAEALTAGLTPFLLGDSIKAVVAALVAATVHRAFPRLLRR